MGAGLEGRAAGILLVAVLAVPGPARAQGRDQYLFEAKRLIHRHRYRKAIHELKRGLSLPGLPVSQEEAILAWLGAAYQLEGRPAEAVDPWRRRVRLVPEASLPADLPAYVRAAYDRVRTATVIIRSLPPPGAFAGRPLTLTATLVDRRGRTSDLLCYYRRAGEPDWQVVRFHRDGRVWRARLVPPPIAGRADAYVLQYYLVAQAPEGEVLHSLGDPSDPLTVKVVASPLGLGTPPKGRNGASAATGVTDLDQPAPAAHRGGGVPTWVWVALGVVAVGAAATTTVVVTSHKGGIPSTTLGAVHYPLTGGRP